MTRRAPLLTLSLAIYTLALLLSTMSLCSTSAAVPVDLLRRLVQQGVGETL